MNRKYHEWRKKIKRIFDDQLQDLIINHHIFNQLSSAWNRHRKSRRGANLAEWMVQTYVAFAATAIRRIAEPPMTRPRRGQRTLSLVILLSDLAANNKLLSRCWYVSRYPARLIEKGLADRDFDRLAGSRANFMPKREINADIRKVKEAAKPMKRLADKVIAHTEEDRRKRGRQVWSDIDEVVKLFAEIYAKYYLLLTAKSFDPQKVVEHFDVTEDISKIWP